MNGSVAPTMSTIEPGSLPDAVRGFLLGCGWNCHTACLTIYGRNPTTGESKTLEGPRPNKDGGICSQDVREWVDKAGQFYAEGFDLQFKPAEWIGTPEGGESWVWNLSTKRPETPCPTTPEYIFEVERGNFLRVWSVKDADLASIAHTLRVLAIYFDSDTESISPGFTVPVPGFCSHALGYKGSATQPDPWNYEQPTPSVLADAFLTFSSRSANALRDMPVANNWLVREYLEAGHQRVDIGQPASGKSLVDFSTAACVATGTSWYGHEVKQGAVLYIAAEGIGGIPRRIAAWETETGVSLKNAPIRFSGIPADLSSDEGAEAVTKDIDFSIAEGGNAPSLIVFDTLACCTVGVDENSAMAMGLVIDRVKRFFIQKYGCAVILVHHEGSGKFGRPRGSSALRGAADAEFRVKRSGSRVRISCTKMKDSEPPEPIWFDLVVHPVGDTTGATLRIADDQSAKPFVMGKNQRTALDALSALSAITEGVTVDKWQSECRDHGIDRRRIAGLQKSLTDSGHIAVSNGFITIEKQGVDS